MCCGTWPFIPMFWFGVGCSDVKECVQWHGTSFNMANGPQNHEENIISFSSWMKIDEHQGSSNPKAHAGTSMVVHLHGLARPQIVLTTSDTKA